MSFDARALPWEASPDPRHRPAAGPRADARPGGPAPRAVAGWLLAVAAMVWAMVAIGGATRLTGSGLSIMEWAPLSGIVPPLRDAEWQRLYDLYRTIPQYELVNRGFGIEGFKEIFWLEWTHRLWGRLIGLVYAAGLLWFWWRGRVPAGLMPRLILLLALGGLQGAVGWFMVASGFEADRTAVSPVRLVLHLGLALVLFAVLLWTALGLLRPVPDAPPATRPLRRLAHATAGLAALTMLAGGFVAGIRAGLDYNTYPLMDGRLVPEGYASLTPFLRNWVSNVAAVQFNHRLLATLTGLAALALLWLALRAPAGSPAGREHGRGRRWALVLAAAVAAQYALGVFTLLYAVPVSLGTLHQAMAVGVLAAALAALHALRPGAAARTPSRAASPSGR